MPLVNSFWDEFTKENLEHAAYQSNPLEDGSLTGYRVHKLPISTLNMNALKGTVENLHRIGDCLAPRKLDHAIYEGELAGRELWSPEERYIYEGELERWEEATVGAPA